MIKIVAHKIAAAVERGKRIGMNAPHRTASCQPIHIAAGERSLASKMPGADSPVTHTDSSVTHTDASVTHTNAPVTHTNAPVTHTNAPVTHTNAPVAHANAPVAHTPFKAAAPIEATGTPTIKSASTATIKSPLAAAIESPSASAIKSTAATHAAAAPAAIAPKVAPAAAGADPAAMTTTPAVGRAVAWGDRTGQQQHRRQSDPADACRTTHASHRGLPHLQAGVPGNTFKADGHHLSPRETFQLEWKNLRPGVPGAAELANTAAEISQPA